MFHIAVEWTRDSSECMYGTQCTAPFYLLNQELETSTMGTVSHFEENVYGSDGSCYSIIICYKVKLNI